MIGEVLSFAAFGIGQALLLPRTPASSLSRPERAARRHRRRPLPHRRRPARLRPRRPDPPHRRRAVGVLRDLFATTALVDLLPTTWRNHVINYMPANAGSQIITVVPTRTRSPPWTGLGVLCLYAAASLIGAAILVTARDV